MASAAIVNTVTMDDGRVVEFAGKRKLLKSSSIDAVTGEVTIRLDFVNGETRVHNIAPALMLKFAAHGAEQKFGDEISGIEDVEDCVMAIDTLMDRLDTGEWNLKRDSNGMSGSSVLAKALVELTGKTIAKIRVFLASKSHAEKVALRGNSKLAPIVAALEATKVKTKKDVIDTDSMLGDLTA